MTSKLGFSLFVKNPAGSICHNNLQYLSSSFKNKLVFKVKILVSDLIKKKKGGGYECSFQGAAYCVCK